MCQEVHVYVCMRVEARAQPVSFLRSFLLKWFAIRSLTGILGLPIMLGWLASEPQGSACLSSLPYLVFTGCWGSNLDPYTCKGSTLLT